MAETFVTASNFKKVFLLCLIVVATSYLIVSLGQLNANGNDSDSYAEQQSQKHAPRPPIPRDARQTVAGRRADNGTWFEQTTPFRVMAYTAFYDDRWSLNTSGPRVVVIVQSAKQLDCCLLRFRADAGDRTSCVVVKAASLGPSLMGCQLPPVNVNRTAGSSSSPPESVSFCWNAPSVVNANETTCDTYRNASTTFQVPVEAVSRRSASSGEKLQPVQEILLCLSNLHGPVDAHVIVEWIEMNIMLGVSRVVIYNHSASKNTVDVLRRYVDFDDSWAELRQSTSQILDGSEYGHQDPTLYDCLYRHAGLYQYIAIWDFDELIIPRQAGLKLLDLVKNASGKERTRIGAFEFRNVYFHLEFPPLNWSVSSSSTLAGLKPLPRSRFLSQRIRGGAWPYRYITKNIMNADSCVVPWTHGCKVWTPVYQFDSPTVIRELDMHPTTAMKHHYRHCHLNSVHGTVCGTDRDVSRQDDVMLRYADELAARLHKAYKRLNLPN